MSEHKVLVVETPVARVHPNADNLELLDTLGYQTVVRKGDFTPGDLAVFIPPDSVVPQWEAFQFLWADKDFDVVPEKYRRITVRRFRKEWSEGLLLPAKSFPELSIYRPGDDVAEVLSIYHYNPPEPETRGSNERGPQYHRWPKSLRGWWYLILRKLGWDVNGQTGGENEPIAGGGLPVYDVENMKHFKDAFQPGEVVVATEKIHGSNGRFTFRSGKMYVGSRKLWKSPASKCVWRECLKQNPWIEDWCRAHENYALYGEVVPVFDGFDYGCKPGEVKFFVFDILTPSGNWTSCYQSDEPTEMLGVYNWVPVLYKGGFDLEELKKLAEGKSQTGGKHIREGVVVRPVVERHQTGLGRLQLKLISNAFLEMK